jgi:hypothetical protein
LKLGKKKKEGEAKKGDGKGTGGQGADGKGADGASGHAHKELWRRVVTE